MARILLVDDDSKTLEFVTHILTAEGYDVTSRTDSGEGLSAALEDPRPDLIITDMNMRGVNGWEFARRIRAEETGPAVPILGLSAFTSAQDRDEAFDAGCNAYENKPINRDRLVNRVRDLL